MSENGKQHAEALKKAAKAMNDAVEAAAEDGLKVDLALSESETGKGVFPRVTIKVFAEVT